MPIPRTSKKPKPLLTPEEIATVLESHPDYKVLRRFVPALDRRGYATPAPGERILTGIFVDVEATGVNPETDKIIQLGLVRFTCSPGGVVYHVVETFVQNEDPGIPIPPEITQLTGISDADVKGRVLDELLVVQVIDGADFFLAHNAEFDRKFWERRFAPQQTPWGCSYRDIDWRAHGMRNAQLASLLQETRGQFYDAHHALADCQVGVHVLAAGNPDREREPYLGELLRAMRQKTIRVFANGSEFRDKDMLKARGYRWEDKRRVWFRDCPEETAAAEIQWLYDALRLTGVTFQTITARDRYSERV